MPTTDQQTNTASAISAIRNAQNLLTQQIRLATDTLTAIKLTNEYNNLDSFLSQLLQAQNSADDAAFRDATTALKSHVDGLNVDINSVQSIVADVKTAADVVSYITKAIGFIAKL